MERCGTCKHWGRDESYNVRSDIGRRRRVCRLTASADGKSVTWEVDNDIVAVALDGESYVAELESRADFGCVLHEGA